MDSAIALNSVSALREDLSRTLADPPTSVVQSTRTSMRRGARRRGRKRDVPLQVAIAVMKAGSLRLDEAFGSFLEGCLCLLLLARRPAGPRPIMMADGKVRRC